MISDDGAHGYPSENISVSYFCGALTTTAKARGKSGPSKIEIIDNGVIKVGVSLNLRGEIACLVDSNRRKSGRSDPCYRG